MVQAQIAGVAMENTGAEPLIGHRPQSVSCQSGTFYTEPVEAAAEA